MAEAKVHYYDHRTGERTVGTGIDWFDDFWWSQAGGSNDGNRWEFMHGYHPEKYLDGTHVINLIVVEKIVSGGRIVYREKVHPLSPLVVAMLVAIDKLSMMQSTCRDWKRRKVEDLQTAITDLNATGAALASCSDSTEASLSFDKAVEQAKKIVECMSNSSAAEKTAEEFDKLEECYLCFSDLVEAACEPFKKK